MTRDTGDTNDTTGETHSADMVVMSAEEAMEAMRAGTVPARLLVEGDLLFYQQDKITPPRALPSIELIAQHIIIHDASLLREWPRVVRCEQLYLWRFQGDFASDMVLEVGLLEATRDWGRGECYLHDCPHITQLPELRLGEARQLRIDQCPQLVSLPASLQVTDLNITACPRLKQLPDVINAVNVSLSGCVELTELPGECVVNETLNLFGCTALRRLPETLETLHLSIGDCRSLTALPQRLRSLYISMNGCAGLTRWDDPQVTTLRQLSARGCVNLETLPSHLRQIDELDVSGCVRLTSLPAELRVTRWVDVGESGVRALPASAQGTQVRWNGINVTGQVAFHPETLTARQMLSEANAEVRRVMLERIGPERFIAEANPQELDCDRDAGGVRRLLRVEMAGDEPLVALHVSDPSTGRMYLLRVPPEMTTCRQAAAWTAGFDQPDDYQPLIET